MIFVLLINQIIITIVIIVFGSISLKKNSNNFHKVKTSLYSIYVAVTSFSKKLDSIENKNNKDSILTNLNILHSKVDYIKNNLAIKSNIDSSEAKNPNSESNIDSKLDSLSDKLDFKLNPMNLKLDDIARHLTKTNLND